MTQIGGLDNRHKLDGWSPGLGEGLGKVCITWGAVMSAVGPALARLAEFSVGFAFPNPPVD